MIKRITGVLHRIDRTRIIILVVAPILAISTLFFAGLDSQSEGVCGDIKPLLIDIHKSSQIIKTTTSIDEIRDNIDHIEEKIQEIYDELKESSLSNPNNSLKRQIIDDYIQYYEQFLTYYYSINIDKSDLEYSNFALFMNIEDPIKVYEQINCEPEEQKDTAPERMVKKKEVNYSDDKSKNSIYYRSENFEENIKREYGIALWAAIIIAITSIFFAYLIYRSGRSDPRYDTHVNTNILFDEQEFPITISNISKGGATIGPDYGFKQGDQISIKIDDDDLIAEVRWVWEANAGIKFVNKISKSAVNRLRKQHHAKGTK